MTGFVVQEQTESTCIMRLIGEGALIHEAPFYGVEPFISAFFCHKWPEVTPDPKEKAPGNRGPLYNDGGPDETRTRNFRRDRPVL